MVKLLLLSECRNENISGISDDIWKELQEKYSIHSSYTPKPNFHRVYWNYMYKVILEIKSMQGSTW